MIRNKLPGEVISGLFAFKQIDCSFEHVKVELILARMLTMRVDK